jgi:hypothetical protein
MSVDLYELVKESQQSKEAMNELLDLFEPKLKKSLLLTQVDQREDLAQELRFVLVNYIRKYNVKSTPGFWELKNQLENKRVW